MPWWLPPPMSNDTTRGAFVLEARLGDDWFVTDDRWTGTVLEGWTATPGSGVSARGREIIDLRSLPAGWNDPDGADPGWPAAIVRRAASTGEPGRPEPPSYPGGPLGARPIPFLAGDEVELRREGDAFLADRVLAGTVVVEATIPVGETVVLRAGSRTKAAWPSSVTAPRGGPSRATCTASGGSPSTDRSIASSSASGSSRTPATHRSSAATTG
jgi:hypothetical protein